jgi:hypothetical protein
MTHRIHLYALSSRPGNKSSDHFNNFFLWTADFGSNTSTPLAIAVQTFEKWHGISATEDDFSITAVYDSSEEARKRYANIPERIHVLRYIPHSARAAEIGAQFVDHLALHQSWWCTRAL